MGSSKNFFQPRILICTIVYYLLFNTSCLLYRFWLYEFGINLIKVSYLEVIYTLVALYLTFLSICINKYFFRICSFFLFISAAIATYYLALFKITPSVRIIDSMMNCENRDVLELINYKIFLWLVFVCIVWWVLIRQYEPNLTKRSKVISIFMFVMIMFGLFSPGVFRSLGNYFPYQYLKNFIVYSIRSQINYLHIYKFGDKFDISSNNFHDKSDSDINVVLIIGEAARFDKFSINGYLRNTNPFLSKLAHVRTFKSISCDTTTRFAVPCMLKHSFKDEQPNPNKHQTTLISIFNKIGFNTSWIANQYTNPTTQRSCYTEPKVLIIPDDLVIVKNPISSDARGYFYDDVLLDSFDHQLSQSNSRKLIILHTLGSHWHYGLRYPEKFDIFQPSSNARLTGDVIDYTSDQLHNMYDNTIVYTDYFIHQVIQRLRDSNAIVFYTSDHGESLGEGGRYLHGGDMSVDEQRSIPFIVWTSDKFNAQNPVKYQNLIKNNKTNINYKYLFHSLLDCSNIESDIIDKSLSVCR